MINARESMRSLDEDAKNDCDKTKKKDPLDLYLQQSIGVDVLKYSDDDEAYSPNRVEFYTMFLNWTESEL